MTFFFFYIFSSPDHAVLKVSYFDRPAVHCPRPSHIDEISVRPLQFTLSVL